MTGMPAYFSVDDCDVDKFAAHIDRQTRAADVPHAARIVHDIPIYDGPGLTDLLKDAGTRKALMAEWAGVLRDGAGVVVFEQAQPYHATIDAVTDLYLRIIADEKSGGAGGADHFAASGANDRLWNSLQKLCDADPALFARYHAIPPMDAVSEAWLGPGYQMTAQVNLVRPGGSAQQAHRDYHLGFQTADAAASYPAHVHALSPVMTLQGGLAHCDMPVESGPTRLLPFSQSYLPGYMAYRLPEFRAFFEDRFVQLPLKKGDAFFFNPALFHAAGDNRSAGIERFANLFQVSSPFGRAMETIDREGMCRALYPALLEAVAKGALDPLGIDAAIAASAEGYSFPTNLDSDPPEGGLAPETQAALVRRALSDKMSVAAFNAALSAQTARRAAPAQG
ncbi:MAG: phytanoyl-CoA dioxygenase family protein [Rhodobacteraceae bacterium]|nr:phytanoyl-CoA dioxygenase family protein [Paracoccaceae bacterium]